MQYHQNCQLAGPLENDNSMIRDDTAAAEVATRVFQVAELLEVCDYSRTTLPTSY